MIPGTFRLNLPAQPRRRVNPAHRMGGVKYRSLTWPNKLWPSSEKITAIRRKAPGKPQRLPSLAPPLLSATADKGVTRVQAQDGAAGKKTEPANQQSQAESISYNIQQPPLTLSEQGRIIAEIVARDIEKLRRGDTSSLQKPDFRNTNIHPE